MDDAPPRRRNHLVWIGPLIAVIGLVSYFFVFARYPAFRDTAWLNLLLVGAGLGMSVVAIRRRPGWLSIGGSLASAACAALLAGYVFGLSNQMPSDAAVVAVGTAAPPFELADHTGAPIGLGELAGTPLVMVFYRGFW
jgi:hypothetical protein